MRPVMFSLGAVAALAFCSGTVSAQTVIVPSYPQPVAPLLPAPGATVVTPGVVLPTPSVIVSPVFPIVRFGYPYYYGRSFYYPHYYYHRR